MTVLLSRRVGMTTLLGLPALERSVAVDATGIPLAVLAAAANRRDDGLLAATLDALGVVDPVPPAPTVHLDAGYDWQPCPES